MYDPEKITYFAETDTRNKRVPFGIKAKDRLRHVYVIGKTGMGKSTLLENMAVQDIRSGEGMAFIDPHGKTADLLLEYVPPERIKDVIYFAPFDIEYPICFNVMEDVGADKRHLVANGLMSAFKKIWVDAWSARMEYILTNTLLALLEYPNSTLLGVNRMLSDKAYREKVVANISDTSVRSFWVDEFAKYGPQYMQEAGAAIQNKIGQFTANPLVRNIIGQEKSTFDIRKIMDEGKIMIINLSKGRMGESNANLLGSMLITKIYLGAMSRADQSEASMSRLPNFYLYVDEFQNFANESFADILSEARKYKLNLTVAHQYIEQMSEEVRAAVFGNVGTMISFRVGSYDAEVLEKEFAPTFTAEDLVNLGFAQIYLKLMIDGIGSQPFSATTLPPIEKAALPMVPQIIDSSRTLYAQPRESVEKVIRGWHEEGRIEEPRPLKKPRQFEEGGFVNRRDARREDRPRGIEPLRQKYEERRDERNIKKEIINNLRDDPPRVDDAPRVEAGFKPLRDLSTPKEPKPMSLDNLKQKSNNQRPATEKHMNDLKSALSAIVKNPEQTHDAAPKPAPNPNVSHKIEEPKPHNKPSGPKEIPRDELEKLLSS